MIFFTYIDLRKFYDFAMASYVALQSLPCLALALTLCRHYNEGCKKIKCKNIFVVIVGKTNAIKSSFNNNVCLTELYYFSLKDSQVYRVYGVETEKKKKKKNQQQIVTLTANRKQLKNYNYEGRERERERERVVKCYKNF